MVKTSYSFKQKARPDELLKDHVMKTAESCRGKSKTFSLIKDISGDLLQLITYLIGLGHDLGKATTYFQHKLYDPKYRVAEANHSELSALITWDVFNQFARQNDINKSLIRVLGPLAYLVVRKHHGAIGNAKTILELGVDVPVLKRQLDVLDVDEIYAIINESELRLDYCFNSQNVFKLAQEISIYWDDLYDYKGIALSFLHKVLFSILVASDKGSVILKNKDLRGDLVENYSVYDIAQYKEKLGNKDSKLNLMREKLYKEALDNTDFCKDYKLLSLHMPTGTGKTLTSLSVASKIKAVQGKKGPIVYCLPFTSIIDQNYQVFAELMELNQGYYPKSEQLLKHHYLAQNEFQDNEQELTLDERRFLRETWESELIVTTFIQFFETLAGHSNRKLLKLHRLREAIIILDEVQAVPLRYWDYIRTILKNLTQQLGCHIILVTATMPLIFEPNEVKSLISGPSYYFKDLHRTTLRLLHRRNLSLPEFFTELEQLIEKNSNRDILIVMNTIKSASQIYFYLKSKEYDREYFYLSTYVVSKERAERLKQLKQISSKPKIIVTTQIVEAGVDLDVGLVVRDFGPLDSINQVAGRCNRHWLREEPEDVYIFRLIDENGRDYARMVYDHELLAATEECFTDILEIPENDFWQLNNLYYEKLKLKRVEVDKNLIRSAERLEHDTVAKNFKMIEEKNKVPVFIQLNEEAQELWQKYLTIRQISNGVDSYSIFAEFKRDFLEYVINVSKKDIGDLKHVEDFYLLQIEQLKDFYHLETGFIKGDLPNV